MSEDVWDAQVDSNLKSVFLTLKHVLPVMERQKSGAIVNVASTSGLRWTGSAQVGYAATKAGVIQLSRVVAVQYAAKGIRVNTVVPGQLHTPMVEARLAKQRAGGDVEALLKSRLERIPLGFMGDGRTPPMPRCSSRPTRHASSPARRSWWTAAWSRGATRTALRLPQNVDHRGHQHDRPHAGERDDRRHPADDRTAIVECGSELHEAGIGPARTDLA